MTTQAESLQDIIIRKIKKEGAISFRDFMDMALYHPRLGYYTSETTPIGKDGDYYTSPEFSFLLGEMLARQLEEMWTIAGKKEFTVVEYGAGNGRLCKDILNRLKENKELFDGLHYAVIEKNMQGETANQPKEKVSRHNSIRELVPLTGCVLSNELIDNFPVHRVVMQDELMEVYEVLKPAGQKLKEHLRELNVTLPQGYRTEINLEAGNWMSELAQTLKQGFVITIDYGYLSKDYYQAQRNCGTLACYSHHHVHDDPYRDIGKQDITSHVNFSALIHQGEKHALQYCGFTDQNRFMRSLGLTDYLRTQEQKAGGNVIGNREKLLLVQTLLMDLGSKLKVLIQQKGFNNPQLRGLALSSALFH
jgi:SAM-dependent MidA family methyltransferase